ncbi:MAG: adenylate/guanylate cyclase domain-containing protein [Pseudomonadota bacterium]
MEQETVTGAGRRKGTAPGPIDGLVVAHDGKEYPVGMEPLFFGRDQKNTIMLLSAKASRQHAVIYRRGDTYMVRDLHSLNGVELNGRAVRQAQVRPGDLLDFDGEKAEIRAGAPLTESYRSPAIAVFVDVARASALIERFGPTLAEHLREVFEKLEDHVLIRLGCPLRSLGAGLLAVFGLWPASDRRYSAADTALEFARHATTFVTQEVYDFLNGEESCTVRVGLALGEVGFHVDDDLDVSGDTVVMAKHLESANRVYGSRILFNTALHDALKDRSHTRELDTVRLANLSTPVTLLAFDERSMMREAANTLVTHQQALEAPLEYLRLYAQGLERYRQGEFAGAFELLDEAVSIYRDAPARCLRDRVVQIMRLKRDGQLGEWDGVWTLETT